MPLLLAQLFHSLTLQAALFPGRCARPASVFLPQCPDLTIVCRKGSAILAAPTWRVSRICRAGGRPAPRLFSQHCAGPLTSSYQLGFLCQQGVLLVRGRQYVGCR